MDRPSIFLSYARRQPDESWADRVASTLRSSFGIAAHFDKRAIRVGHDFRSEIERGVAAADAVVFLGSTSSLTSPYCLDECKLAIALGKPLLPLFIEPVDWTGFPAEFHALHFEQLYRAGADDEALAAMVGKSLVDGGFAIDPASIPERSGAFDEWAGNIHPQYGAIRQVDKAALRGFVEECARKLALRPSQGYHNLNIALLHLRLADFARALRHAELSLADLPGRPDAYYFTALIAAAQGPLMLAPKARIERVIQLTESALKLDDERPRAAEDGLSGLPLVLRAVVAHEYYLRNGFISRCGEPEALVAQARAKRCSPPEVLRLLDTLADHLSPAGRGLIEKVNRA